MENLIIHNVKLNEDETDLLLILLNLGFNEYLQEMVSNFTGDKDFDSDCLRCSIREIRKLFSKLGIGLDFELKVERKEKENER